MNGAVPPPAALAGLEAQLQELLDTHPAGLSEHELLKHLRERNPLFAGFSAREPLSLFRGHYLLFHALYRLRDRLGRERRGRLTINPLRIALEPAGSANGSPSHAVSPVLPEADLSAWYGDLNRSATITAAEVVELLRRFHAARRANDQRQAALAELGLQDPVDDATIKQCYRRLAMRHHPDRGGDGVRLREINEALAVLVKVGRGRASRTEG